MIDSTQILPEAQDLFTPALLSRYGGGDPVEPIPLGSPIFDLAPIHEHHWAAFSAMCGAEQTSAVPYDDEATMTGYEQFCRFRALPQHAAEGGSALMAFVYRLFMTYESSLTEVSEMLVEYPSPMHLEHLRQERERLVRQFRQTVLGGHWCRCIESEQGLLCVAKFYQHRRRRGVTDTDEENFFRQLDRICIISDVLRGKAAKYWLDVEYPDGWRADTPMPTAMQKRADADAELVAELMPMFWNEEPEVRSFVKRIGGAKNQQIIAVVAEWVEDKKISDASFHRPLWAVLHGRGIYTASETNWNKQLAARGW